ncbi:hypothetical protein IFR05_016321 [Cadophora sp. M221]|nr:hypothetical protein IFR05_016321 [Cadophora sp. M221]
MKSNDDDDFIDELGGAPSDEVLNVDELDREGSSGEEIGSSEEEIDEDGSSEEGEVDEDGSREEEVDGDGSSEEEVDEDEEEVDEDELGKQLDLSNNEFEACWNAILAKHTPKHKETKEELQRRKEADDYLDRNENKTRLLNVKSLTSLSRRMGRSIGPQQCFNKTSLPPIQRPFPQSGPNNHDRSPFSSGAIKRQKNHEDESPSHRSPKHIRTRSPSRCQTELEEDNGQEASTTATLPGASTYTTEALPRPLATTTCRAKPARRSNQIRQPFIPGTPQFAGLKAITLGLVKDPKQPRGIGINIVTATFDSRGRFAMRVNCQDMDGHYIPLPEGIPAPASFEDINLLPRWREYSSDNIREAVALEYARQ